MLSQTYPKFKEGSIFLTFVVSVASHINVSACFCFPREVVFMHVTSLLFRDSVLEPPQKLYKYLCFSLLMLSKLNNLLIC